MSESACLACCECLSAVFQGLHAGHVLAGGVYVAMVLMLRGAIGRGAGLHDLFRDKPAHATLFGDPNNPARWHIWLSPGFTSMALFTIWIGMALGLLGLPLRAPFPPGSDAAVLADGWVAFLVLLTLALGALIIGRPPREQDGPDASAAGKTKAEDAAEAALENPPGALFRRMLGLGAGLAVAAALGYLILPAITAMLHRLAPQSEFWLPLAIGLLPFLLAVVAMMLAARLWIQTGAAWFVLLIVLTTGFAALAQMPVVLLVFAAVALAVWLSLRLTRFRYRIPGIPARYYRQPITPGAPPTEPPPTLVAPEQALEAWRGRLDSQEKPRLVLVALSGGGYRATFWAASVLDRLFALDRRFAGPGEETATTNAGTGEHLDGFVDSIRFIAGASGGMVTGGYLAELSARAARAATGAAAATEKAPSLVTMIEGDIDAYQSQPRPIAPPGMPAPRQRRVRIARDSLSAVAWQLLADLGHVFRTGAVSSDRGRVLQAHWPTLDTPFHAWRDDEAQGNRPSVIYAPMLIESGAPFFISNLDLNNFRQHFTYRDGRDDADEHSAELFRVLPGAHDEPDGRFTVATAARLSSSFPYVLPAVSLPSQPHRRVVDAGYYDNFGIDVVTGLLNTDKVRDWVVGHCSGVLIIALRAFPDQPPANTAPALARLFWWLSSPIEAMFNARGSSQTFRNREQLRLTRQIYGAALAAQGDGGDWQQQGRDFIDIVTFTCDEESSMSWHLSEADMARLHRGAQKVTARACEGGRNDDMQRLLAIWNNRHVKRPPQPGA